MALKFMMLKLSTLLSSFSFFFLIGSATAQSASTPRIQATLDGPRTVVFQTPEQSCSANDIPDSMARAFRDENGVVHFFTASAVLYASLGPDLDHLTHSCKPAYSSPQGGNPADYDDEIWLSSFYTFDGKTVAALSHTEYHGWSFAGECNTSNINQCEFDSDTYHQSNNGGYRFDSFAVPRNVVAGVPFEYVVDSGPVGYSVDTNIVPYDGYFYAITTDDGSWPIGCSGSSGPNACLVPSGGGPIRTTNVFDPSSWRGWDGSDFKVRFVDPYLGPVQHPESHVYTPLPYMEFATGLNLYQPANVVVATLLDYFNDALGEPGMYFTTSTDMVHWTRPELVVTLRQILDRENPKDYLYAYFSLIDPAAPDMSFSVIGNHPYLYYVRLSLTGQERKVFRQRLTLSSNR
jgi:hypothetical protein